MKKFCKMKKNTLRAINAIIWSVMFVAIMIATYFEWSSNGEYTAVSFIVSFVIYGFSCGFMCQIVDNFIKSKL